MKRHLVLLIHGMNPDASPGDPSLDILHFFNQVRDSSAHLVSRLPDSHVLPIRWGHPDALVPAGAGGSRPDLLLMQAQNHILSRMYPQGPIGSAPSMEWMASKLHAALLIPGIGDMIYFIGSDGYAQIRDLIYNQSLIPRVMEFAGNDTVCLHIIAISLGVTIAHEFLRGIFSDEAHLEHGVGAFSDLRHMVGQHRLELGSLICAASQLPLLLLRSGLVVETMAAGGLLDPAEIGLRESRQQWLLFHDENDLLSLPTRALYRQDAQAGSIEEVRVVNEHGSLGFVASHTGYWRNPVVQEKTRQCLLAATEHWVDF